LSIDSTHSPRSGAAAAACAEVGVVGAGIVGVCCAAELAALGHRVTLFDRDAPGRAGASRANAGQVIPSLIQPVAYPGIWRDAPGLLLNPASPLSIPLTRFPRLLPWLLRFLAASRRRRHERGIAALAELNAGALDATRDLYERAGIASLLQTSGALHLYESEASLARARRDWALKDRYGFPHRFVTPAALRDLEPDLAASFCGAVLEPGVAHVSDPLKVVEGIFRFAAGLGAGFQRGEAAIAGRGDDGIVVTADSGSRRRFDALVIAAGAWSRHLLKQIGDGAPLESERGYNITIPDPGVDVRHCLVFADRGFVATPLEPGLRIGGGVELGGLARAPDPRRLESMLRIARRHLPALRPAGGSDWMGHRPALPDSVPIIARSPVDRRIVYAFGHGHLGLTQGPVTGRRVAALIGAA